MINKPMKASLIIFTIVLLLISTSISAPEASAQEDVSDFTQTFQIFMQSRDAFRLYDITPEEVIYALPDDYQIGPGDILQVILTGMISDALVVQVGPQGDIFVPPAGLIDVDGMTIEDAQEVVDWELGMYLVNYQCSIQLLKARRINVYLLGQVRQPGQYIALSGTTALGVIQTAGSLVANPISVNYSEMEIAHPYFRALTAGAGRWAEIHRDGELIGRIDLASVAIGGLIREDIVLEDGDAIYIASNQSPVVVRGGVTRPGTYEVGSDDTVLDLIAQAGGYRSMMMLGKIDIERPNPEGSASQNQLISLNLTDPNGESRNFQMMPGDIIRVPEVKDQVYVMGAVWAPQSVDYHEGWTILDYLAETGGPVAPTDISSIIIVKFPLDDNRSRTVFSLKNVYLGEEFEVVQIDPGDMIWVPWKNQPFYGGGLTNAISVILGQSLGLLRIIQDIS